MMLRFDAKLALPSQPYFYTNFAAYVAGLGLTVGVMHFFDSAQPALLYLARQPTANPPPTRRPPTANPPPPRPTRACLVAAT